MKKDALKLNGSGRIKISAYRRKALGQHFLTSGTVRDRIIEALGPLEGAHVLEIGAGGGELTYKLAGRAARLTVLEIDPALSGRLEQELQDHPEVSVRTADAVQFDYAGWAGTCAPLAPLVVGNIPYHITNPLLYTLLGCNSRLGVVVLMLQEEVARKLTAPAGGKPYGLVSVYAAYYAATEYLFSVGRNNFRPPPRVDSAVVRLDFDRPFAPRARNAALFESLVRRLFLERRKQVQKILRSDRRFSLDAEKMGGLEELAGLDLTCRPEMLTVAELVRLSDCLSLEVEDR